MKTNNLLLYGAGAGLAWLLLKGKGGAQTAQPKTNGPATLALGPQPLTSNQVSAGVKSPVAASGGGVSSYGDATGLVGAIAGGLASLFKSKPKTSAAPGVTYDPNVYAEPGGAPTASGVEFPATGVSPTYVTPFGGSGGLPGGSGGTNNDYFDTPVTVQDALPTIDNGLADWGGTSWA